MINFIAVRHFFSPILLVLTSLSLASQDNQVEISIPPPTWNFEIKYGLLNREKPKLFSHEQDIALGLRPLIQAEKYQQAWRLVTDIDPKDASPALLQAKGQIAMQLKNTNEAIEAFTLALDKKPDLLSSHRTLAAIYIQKNTPNLARKHLSHAIQLGDQDPSLFAQLAYLHMQENESYSAIAGFRQALFLAPSNTHYKQGLLWALTESGDTIAASALLKEMIVKTPDNPTLWLQLAKIALSLHNEKDALASMEIALRLGQQSTSNLILCAQLHIRHGSSQQAARLLGIAVNQGGDQYEAIIDALNVLASRDPGAMTHTLIKVLEQHQSRFSATTHSQFLTIKGSLLNQNSRAISLYKKAISLDPTNGSALIKVGHLLVEQNKLDQADMYFSRAASMEKYREQAWLSSAQIAISQGNFSRALSLLKTASKHNPHRADLKKNIQQIEQLNEAI